MGRCTKSNIFPRGVKGKMSVATTTAIVAMNRYVPGRLLKNGLLLRMTSTIIDAENNRFHKPSCSELRRCCVKDEQQNPKVDNQNRADQTKVIMNFLIRKYSHRLGVITISTSVRSVAMVISGKSVIRFVNRICLGSRGRKDRNREAPAMLTMFPKLALVAIKTYFIVLASVSPPLMDTLHEHLRFFSRSTISADSWPHPPRYQQRCSHPSMEGGNIIDAVSI